MKQKLLTLALYGLITQAASFAAFVQIDNFESYVTGSEINNQGDWTSESSFLKVAVDPADAGNKVLLVATTEDGTFRTYNDNSAINVPDGSTATLFARFRMASGDLNVNFGLSDIAVPGSNTYNDFESQVRTFNGVLDVRDGGGFQSLSGGGASVDNADAWYNLWMVANNDSDLVTLYIQSDDDPAFATQTELVSADPPTSFRFGTTDALVSFYLVINTIGADVYLDDFWIDTAGENLVNPIAADGPVTAVADDVELGVSGSVAFDPTVNDLGGIDPASLSIVTGPAQGSLSTDPVTGSLIYRHTGGVAGADSFRYRISNFADSLNDEADVSITISGDLRLENTSLSVPLDPPAAAVGQLIMKDALPGLTFADAVALATVPGSPKALMVGSINGSIWYVPDTTVASPTSHLILDVASLSNFTNNRSIYSFTCFPDFETSGNIVINYQGDGSRLPAPSGGETIHDVIPNLDRDGVPYPTITTDLRVSRFTLSAAHIADAVANGMSGSENQAALDTEFPYINLAEQNTIHTVLDCKFGPEGYLFITFGDEGGQPDPHRNGQRITKDYFGSLLRIDVNPGSTNPKPNPHYTIPAGPLSSGTFPFFTDKDSQEPNFRVPADNPFIHTSLGGTWSGDFNGTDISDQLDSVRTEIWALGLRTPFRFHIDTEDGTGETEAWIGDVGWEDYEEINLFKNGDNGGWSYYEGPIRTPTVTHASMPAGATPLTPALHSYETEGFYGNSVTGGIFYRGNTLPSLTNTYIFGDYGTGRIMTLTRGGDFNELSDLRLGGNDVVDFEIDAETGEIFVLEHSGSGRVRRISEETNLPTDYPLTLSETGIFADFTDLSPNPGIIPYTPNLTFWSDDADKYRWFVIPNLTDTMGYTEDGIWTFPEGMVWIKHFDFDVDQSNPGTDIQRLETRLLVRNEAGSYGVSYRWKEDGSDADLADNAGEDFEINFTDPDGQPDSFTWRIPSRAECLTCHSAAAGHALSLNSRQFNLSNTISGQTGNLLTLLSDAGYLNGFDDAPEDLPRHHRPDETEVNLETRVRSYLDVNCAYCHFPEGGTPHSWDARSIVSTLSSNMLYGEPISEGAPNDSDRIIWPGNKDESSIWNKINARSAGNGTFNGHTQMPPLASNRIDEDGIAMIAEWIDNYANVPPSVPPASIEVAEGTPIDSVIASSLASDPDVRGGTSDQSQLSYSITSVGGNAFFAVDPSSGEVIVADHLIFEQTDSHTFEITVSDNFTPNPMTSLAEVTINVTDSPNEDIDGNQIPDAWEVTYGILGAPDGNDEDGDGLPDFFELVTGKNPINPISSSVITLDPTSPGGTTYSWRYQVEFTLGTDYLLQGSDNMLDWAALTEGVDYEVVSDEAEQSGFNRITIRLLSNSASRYFLRLSAP